ncbi:hypothetical protein GCM10010411_92340 [Actinomadura fulvescens]|uniref:Uncharacterized protein n=1 Tax=Actinomadura fulvescens TaxID=46160 RepID=A0ABN3QY45_9ACTN
MGQGVLDDVGAGLGQFFDGAGGRVRVGGGVPDGVVVQGDQAAAGGQSGQVAVVPAGEHAGGEGAVFQVVRAEWDGWLPPRRACLQVRAGQARV